MITFNDFEEQWKKVSPQIGGYIRLDLEHPLDLEVGYYADNSRSLVVMDSIDAKALPSSAVVRISNIKTGVDRVGLELRLLNPNFEDVFLRLCWDLVSITENVNDPWKNFTRRYLQWHKLLENSKDRKIMSFSKQKGLIGELLFMEKQIDIYGIEAAIQSWKGPEGCDQDFQYMDTWAEVKTVSLSATSVKISSLEQLRQDVDGSLVVYVLEKSDTGENLINLPLMISKIKDMVEKNEYAGDLFYAKLTLLGYREKDEVEYEKNKFRLIEERCYEVSEGFPKLTIIRHFLLSQWLFFYSL